MNIVDSSGWLEFFLMDQALMKQGRIIDLIFERAIQTAKTSIESLRTITLGRSFTEPIFDCERSGKHWEHKETSVHAFTIDMMNRNLTGDKK
jgi:hypothetical protein